LPVAATNSYGSANFNEQGAGSMTYRPIVGTAGAVAQFWLAAKVDDYWFEFGADAVVVAPAGIPQTDTLHTPMRKLVLALGPIIASDDIVNGRPGISGATGGMTRIAFMDLPAPYENGMLPYVHLNAVGTYDCSLPTAAFDEYMDMLSSGRACFLQSDIDNPLPAHGQLPPAEVAVLASYLSNQGR